MLDGFSAAFCVAASTLDEMNNYDCYGRREMLCYFKKFICPENAVSFRYVVDAGKIVMATTF